MGISLAELAAAVGGEVVGDSDLRVEGPAAQGEECAGRFVATFDQEALDRAVITPISAILMPRDLPPPDGKAAVVVDDVRLAFVRALQLFAAPAPAPGIHPSAQVHPSASLGQGV